MTPGPDPLNATYLLRGEPITLADGRFESELAPGSASRRIVRAIGTPASGDLDGDGRVDHALVLVDDPGGSGTFYHVAAALAAADGYRGTNALPIGDRVEVSDVTVAEGAVTVRYLARKPGEAMAVRPSMPMAARFTLSATTRGAGGDRAAHEALRQSFNGALFEGWVVIGHEVRTFSPCSRPGELWIQGEDDVHKAIARAHAAATTGKRPHLPVLMQLTGRIQDSPDGGLGAGYRGAFLTTGLVAARPGTICLGDRITLATPAAGDVVRSPLHVEGRARSSWFNDGLLPIALLDASGHSIARGHAVATDARGPDGFIGFRGTLQFERRKGSAATLLIMENDPDKAAAERQASRVPVVVR